MSGKKQAFPTVKTNSNLQTMFLRLRRRYWINENIDFPGLDRVMVSFVVMKDYDGRHVFDPNPKHNPDGIHFLPMGVHLIDDWEECEQVLLHEMAHLAVDRYQHGNHGSHGQLWKDEMARLVKLGAVKP